MRRRSSTSTQAGRKIYCLQIPRNGSRSPPSWCLTDKELIVALFPQNVKAYLSRRRGSSRWPRRPEVADARRGHGPMALAYVDTPESVRLAIRCCQIGARCVDRRARPRGDRRGPLDPPVGRVDRQALAAGSHGRGADRRRASRSSAGRRCPRAASRRRCRSRRPCCCPRCNRRARRRGGPSRSTTSSRSAWRCTITTTRTTDLSRRPTAPTRTASRC